MCVENISTDYPDGTFIALSVQRSFFDTFESNLDALRRHHCEHQSYVDQAAGWYKMLSWWQRRAMMCGLFSMVTSVGLALHIATLSCLLALIVGALFFFLLEQHSETLEAQENRITAEFGLLKSSVQNAVLQLRSVEKQLQDVLSVATVLEGDQRALLQTLSKRVCDLDTMTESLVQVVVQTRSSGEALAHNTRVIGASFYEAIQMLDAFRATQMVLLRPTNVSSKVEDARDLTALFHEAEETIRGVDVLLSRAAETALLSVGDKP